MKEEVVIQMAAKTNVGRIRALNEDNFIVTNNIGGADWFLPAESYTNGVMGTVMVIADGMGGTNAGEVASRIAVESVQKYFNALSSSPVKTGKTGAILKDAILYAHKAIVNFSYSHPETEGMGTTLVLCWIFGGRAYVGWSGDSRCYAWNPARGLRQLTKDHSYVQALIDDGKITAAQAFDHPQNNIVLQSLGDATVEPEPDVAEMPIEKDDWLLLCSDGLSGMLTDAEIADILRAAPEDVGAAISLLIDRANEAGGADNITVVAARVLENTLPAQREMRTIESRPQAGGKKRWRWFGIIGLAAIAVALAAYSYIHHRQKTTGDARPPDRHGSSDSGRAGGAAGGAGQAKDPGEGAAPEVKKPAKPKGTGSGQGKGARDGGEVSGDPSAVKNGTQATPGSVRGGDRHPVGETPGDGKQGGDSSNRHSRDAGEVARHGAPVPGDKPTPGQPGPQQKPKKDSVKGHQEEL